MKEKGQYLGLKENNISLRSQGVLLMAIVTLLTSCSFPVEKPIVHDQILNGIKDSCSEARNPVCWTELRSVPTDLYNYHCWAIMWNEDGSSLEIDGYMVEPTMEQCPDGSFQLSPRRIPDRCLVFIDNGNGRLDYDDNPARHLCATGK